MVVETTIGVSKKLKKFLIINKLHKREPYEDIIWRLVKERKGSIRR